MSPEVSGTEAAPVGDRWDAAGGEWTIRAGWENESEMVHVAERTARVHLGRWASEDASPAASSESAGWTVRIQAYFSAPTR